MKDKPKELADFLLNVKEVKKINLEKGDVLIIETEECLNPKAYEYYEKELLRILPNNKCIILEKMKLKAILSGLVEPNEKALETMK